MGGFASASHARTDGHLLGVFLIDAWNVGNTGEEFAKVNGSARAALINREFDDLGIRCTELQRQALQRQALQRRSWRIARSGTSCHGPGI